MVWHSYGYLQPTQDCQFQIPAITVFRVLVLKAPAFSPSHLCSPWQVSFLEKKVTELENDSLTNGDLKSKLKQENTQLVHRSAWGRSGPTGQVGFCSAHTCAQQNRSLGTRRQIRA